MHVFPPHDLLFYVTSLILTWERSVCVAVVDEERVCFLSASVRQLVPAHSTESCSFLHSLIHTHTHHLPTWLKCPGRTGLLFNTRVSQFELNYWNKWTFPRHSNLLRCTCIYIYIYDWLIIFIHNFIFNMNNINRFMKNSYKQKRAN